MDPKSDSAGHILSPAARVFVEKHVLGRALDVPSSKAQAFPDIKNLAKRTAEVVKKAPQAKPQLVGLLKAVKDATDANDLAEAIRQADMLEGRLDGWGASKGLPDIKDVLEGGFADLSQKLAPEDLEEIAKATANVDEITASLPAGLQRDIKIYQQDVANLQARGEKLVGLIEAGNLGPIPKAAHHSEIDQICTQIETRTAQMQAALEKENVS